MINWSSKKFVEVRVEVRILRFWRVSLRFEVVFKVEMYRVLRLWLKGGLGGLLEPSKGISGVN